MKPHKHAEIIKQWADGAKIEFWNVRSWVQTDYPAWDESMEYRIKPEPAASKWPQTTMTDEQLIAAWENGPEALKLTATANAAIAHLCESGALVPADKVREIEAKAHAQGMKDGIDQERARIQLYSTLGGQMIGYLGIENVNYKKGAS